jgi:hypothetical protein
MPFRRTKKEALVIAGWVNGVFSAMGNNQVLTVEWCGATGRGRALLDEGTVNLSPLLPTGELVDWLRAYHAGLKQGIVLGVTPPSAASQYASVEVVGEVFTTHMQRCPICGHDLTIAADNALIRGGRFMCACPECEASLTIDFAEEIAWTITAIQSTPEEKPDTFLGFQLVRRNRRDYHNVEVT